MTPEGYYNPATGNYYYYLKDHLGNNRITYHYTGSAPVIDQEVEYYPFGSMFTANNLQNNLYLYNGKELNNEFFENYDYGVRFYDPQIGRFTTLDPKAELGRRWSPYTYAFDNPMRFIDPDGMWPNTNVLYGSIKKTLNEVATVKSQHPEWSNARVLGTTLVNRTTDMATYTDANDAVVIGTTFTRGSNAVNLDGTKATTGDKIAAFAGLALPSLSGSTIKKAFGAIGDALGLSTKADNAVAGGKATSQGADFVVSQEGTAVPTSQSRMVEGFENAGFNSTPTSSPGTQYTLPDGRTVRAMEPSGDAPRRASFENSNGQPVDMDGNTVQPPRGLSRSERLEYIRNRTHLTQDK